MGSSSTLLEGGCDEVVLGEEGEEAFNTVEAEGERVEGEEDKEVVEGDGERGDANDEGVDVTGVEKDVKFEMDGAVHVC